MKIHPVIPSGLIALVFPLVAATLVLTGCSAGAASPVSTPATAARGTTSSSVPAAPAGSASTDGVCGRVPIDKVNAIIGRKYVNSKEVAIPDMSLSDAAYCYYTTASGVGEFAIQVVTSSPSDAITRLNDATGDKLIAQSGIGDSALYTDSYPELVVVYGQTTIAVGQSGQASSDANITLNQLEKLANAVHSAG